MSQSSRSRFAAPLKFGIAMIKRQLHRQFSILIFLIVLSACASPGEKQQIAENCALAKERQNDMAIDYWCFGRRPNGY